MPQTFSFEEGTGKVPRSARTGTSIKPAPAPEEDAGPSVWDQVTNSVANAADRVGLAIGLIDPATYRGRGEQTGETVATQAAPRGVFDRMVDAATFSHSAAGRGEVSALQRRFIDALDLDDDYLRAQRPDWTPEQREAYRDARQREEMLRQREAYDYREQGDPVMREGDAWYSPGTIARFGAEMLGDMAGQANPTYLLGPGSTMLRRGLAQGGINAGIDVGIQGAEINEGLQDGFDPARAATQFGAGFGLQVGGETLARMLGRGPKPANATPDEDLLDVSLDGGAPAGPLAGGGAADELARFNQYVQSLGPVDNRFMQDQLARQRADIMGRVALEQGGQLDQSTRNIGAEMLRERADLTEAVQAGEMDPSYMPGPLAPRTVPEGVTMQAYPEGTVRSDEQGSIIGLLRNLAANQNVIDQATARAADNPTLRAILEQQASTNAKVGALWPRLQAMIDQPAPDVQGPLGIDPATLQNPQQRPTVEQARGVTENVTLPVKGRVTSRFGQRDAPTKGASTNHGGMDIAAPRGTPVAAPSSGTVVAAGEAGANGNLVRIDHGNGVVSSYAHLDGINVRIGQTIGKGEQLGTVGSTGRSTGPHLHYAISENGVRVDPESYRFAETQPDGDVWRVGDQGNDPFDMAQGPTERRRERASPTDEERARGADFRDRRDNMFYEEEGRFREQYESPMGTSGNRPFKDVRAEDDRPEARGPQGFGPPPDGTPPRAGRSYFEDNWQKAADDLAREYEASQSRRRERESSERAKQKDASEQYRNKYGSKPAQGEDGNWRMTDDGIVADADGAPVAFRNHKEAAKWAAKNRMAGDVELESWGTNTTRVILRKRANSTYGQQQPRPDDAPAGTTESTSDEILSLSPPSDGVRGGESPSGRVEDAEAAPRPNSLHERRMERIRALNQGSSREELEDGIEYLDEAISQFRARGMDATELDELQAKLDDMLTGRAPGREGDLARSRMADTARKSGGPRAVNEGATETVTPKRVTGKRETVVTPQGREVETEFEVRELSDVQQATGMRQPRNRDRDASDMQVNDIAAKLDPEQLKGNRQAANGSPIIGPDGVIEVGNGRTRAIERAYANNPERIEAYKQMMRDEGYDIEGFERPILVRRRITDMSDDDMRAWVNEAQDSGAMRYSAPEQAKADAGAISVDTLGLYRGGDINLAGNRDFVKAWMADTKADRNAMLASDGTLSPDGANRIRASILARAFDDETLVGKLLGDSDNNIKAIGDVLLDAAPKFAQVKEAVKDGKIGAEFDISKAVAEMAGLISRARANGEKLGDLLGQSDMFGKNVDAVTETLVRLMFKDQDLKRPRSKVRLQEAFDFYLDGALRTEDGPGMFGDALKPVDILEAARAKIDAKDSPPGQGSIFKLEERGKPFDFGKKRSQVEDAKTGRQGSLNKRLAELVEVQGMDPDMRDLASRLLDFDETDVSLRIASNELRARSERANGSALKPGQTIAGDFERRTATIRAHSEFDVETILHEAIHARLIRRYGDEFSEMTARDLAYTDAIKMVRLYNQARARYGKYGWANRKLTPFSVEYALTNVDEFIAQALTVPAVKRWLQKGTLWDQFVDAIRGVFNLPKRLTPMLDDVLRTGRNLLEKAREDAIRYARDESGTLNVRLDKIVDGEGLKRDAAALKKAFNDPKSSATAIARRIKDGVSWTMFTADSRGRGVADRIESDAAHELLDHFHARAGRLDDAPVSETFHEAVQKQAGARSQQAFRALEGITGDKAKERRVADLLRYPNRKSKATAEELEAAKKLRELFKDTIEYRKASGEEIGEVSDGYFPRWLDLEKVLANSDEFLKRAERLYRDIGLSAKEAKDQAQSWLEHTIDTYAGLDGGLDIFNAAGDTVGSRTAQSRQFGKRADAILADFYQDDLLAVTAQYFHGAARKAEMTRRFGKKGAVGSAERKAWEAKHKDKTQLDVLEDRIREDARAHGADGAGAMSVLRDIHGKNLGRLRANMSARQRAAVAWAHTWTQLGVMDRAVLTSLAELAMGFTRGGLRRGLPFVKDSMKQYYRQLRNAPPDDAARWAEAIGVAQDAIVNTALTARASIESGTEGSSKVLQKFYEATTLHQYTEGTRIAAVKMGREFIDQLAKDMESSSARVRSRAKKYLGELGVSDPDGFAKTLRNGGFALDDVSRETTQGAKEYATALIRFTNQTVMRPTRAEKPVWASHPVGGMFFSLMSYSYGFKKNVLDRTGRLAMQAIKDKDPTLLTPALGLAILTGWQYLNDTYIRTAIFGGGPPEDETAMQAGLRTADRAGLTGALSPIINAFTGVRYQRSLGDALLGPVIGRPADALTKMAALAVNNSENTNTAERAAAGAIFDNLIEPGVDGLAAARLLGAARTGVVMGTGVRDDKGALPSDREFFIESVAGKKGAD